MFSQIPHLEVGELTSQYWLHRGLAPIGIMLHCSTHHSTHSTAKIHLRSFQKERLFTEQRMIPWTSLKDPLYMSRSSHNIFYPMTSESES